MNEAFVDVTWRGLEVGKRVKLHGIHPGEAYLDHATPMPVGTLLSIKTDEGLEIAATVSRVHEQVGGTNESPGMQIVPKLEGAAKAWWQTRAEALPAPIAAPVTVTVAAPSPMAVLAAAAGNGSNSDPRSDIVSRSTLTMSTVEVQRALAAMKGDGDGQADPEAGNTDVMDAVDPATIEGLAGETGGEDGIVDDGKRTMVMSAVDVSAIVEASETETSGPVNGDDGNGTDDGPSGDGPSGDGAAAGAKGKKRRGGRKTKRG